MDKFRSLSGVSVSLMVLVHFLAAMTAPITNITTDQSALLAFKSHITHNDVVSLNWSIATSCCSWVGVTCGGRHHRVTALNLSYMGLTGTLPPQLGSLSFLVSLNLINNSFHGNLPEELGLLRRLKFIRLQYNQFTGELPLSFGNLTKLQLLYLSDNQFYGQIPLGICKCRQLQNLSLAANKFSGSIPREIGNLTLLKYIYFGMNNLEGVIPQEMGNLVSLVMLSMEYNSLSGPVSSSLFNISSLKILYLPRNNLSGSLPEVMCNHVPILEELDLSYNQLTGLIPSGSWGCRKLVVLSLRNNSFTGSIPREIGNLTAIKEILLDSNNLKGLIPLEMDNLITLEILILQFNGLTGPISHTIFNISTMKLIALNSNYLSGQLPSTIGHWLPNIEELYLWGNNLGGVIPSSISNASKLAILAMSENSFTGSIPNTLGHLRLLEVLQLHTNFLTAEPSALELSFLTSLTNCQYLRRLEFSNNPLGGVLPISIGNLSTSLTHFYAHGCKFRGNIPREIGKLSNLIGLGLSNNEFTGSIPTTIRRLQKLQQLSANGNRLQGSIPYDLCHLKSLVGLLLEDNILSGSIPACMGNLTSLRFLKLGFNKLTTTIPSTLWSLRDILELNLSTNSLSGYLPVEVGNLKVVTSMDFSRNRLSGDIPSSVGGLQYMDSLNLANNRLQGPIPQSFENLITLSFLDVSNNSLTGVIPKSLEALFRLKYLNLSSNKLEGEIPNEGPFANFSAQSFMMNRALCGAPRLQVRPCKTDQQSRRTVVNLLRYILPAIASIFLLVALILVLIRRRKGHVKSPSQADLSTMTWRRISYLELLQATNGFCESNILGTGSFGSVYKGVLSNEVHVAVKVFNLQLEGAFQSFETECEVLRNIRHRNLVKIISSCTNPDFKCLLLEYMPNGSLDRWLYSINYCLDILQRLNIMVDIATALEYLHHGYSTLVVHCDLKPGNVLLDGDMVAKVGDFGITKLLGEQESMIHTKTLATVGYMAPEYGSKGVVSPRGDVYSFGILMMETFTRKKPTDEIFGGEMSLKRWVKASLPNAVIDVADANLLSEEEEHFAAKEDCIVNIMELALQCSRDVPEERIGIKDALITLKRIRNNL